MDGRPVSWGLPQLDCHEGGIPCELPGGGPGGGGIATPWDDICKRGGGGGGGGRDIICA